MDITNTQKYVSSSPRKLRLVADMVRKMEPVRALQILQFTNKAAALPISKAIKTAVANALVQGVKAEDLSFKRLEINKGLDLKRMRSAGRGRRRLYSKSSSHIRVVLTDESKPAKHGASIPSQALPAEKVKLQKSVAKTIGEGRERKTKTKDISKKVEESSK